MVLLLPFGGSKFNANKVHIIYCSLKQKQSETILWMLHLWKLSSYILLLLSFKFSLRSNKHNSCFLSLKVFFHLPYIVRSGTRLVQGGKDWRVCGWKQFWIMFTACLFFHLNCWSSKKYLKYVPLKSLIIFTLHHLLIVLKTVRAILCWILE